jgi:ATP-dependent Clp protease protease subunit
MRDRLNRIFAKATGQPLERIEEDTHRNFWLDAESAVRYGLAGRIIERQEEMDLPEPRARGAAGAA